MPVLAMLENTRVLFSWPMEFRACVQPLSESDWLVSQWFASSFDSVLYYIYMYVKTSLHVVAIINPRRACAGGLRYLSVCLFVCLQLSVCYHLVVNIVRFYGLSMVRTALV